MMNKTNNQQLHLKAEKVVDWGYEGGSGVMIDSLCIYEVNAPCTSQWLWWEKTNCDFFFFF